VGRDGKEKKRGRFAFAAFLPLSCFAARADAFVWFSVVVFSNACFFGPPPPPAAISVVSRARARSARSAPDEGEAIDVPNRATTM
jgi:hypothetical protein